MVDVTNTPLEEKNKKRPFMNLLLYNKSRITNKLTFKRHGSIDITKMTSLKESITNIRNMFMCNTNPKMHKILTTPQEMMNTISIWAPHLLEECVLHCNQKPYCHQCPLL